MTQSAEILYKEQVYYYEFIKQKRKVIIYGAEPVKLDTIRLLRRKIKKEISKNTGLKEELLYDYKSHYKEMENAF